MMDVVFNFGRCEHCRMKFLRNIRISGHSLAAHTAGWIGYLIKYETGYCIGIIYGNFICPYTAGRRLITLLFFHHTALDPAGPFFYGAESDHTDDRILFFRLHHSQACFVQVMHTNTKSVYGSGFHAIIGHADYFVYGGEEQPGCAGDFLCSHLRPIFYFRESMARPALGRRVMKLGSSPASMRDRRLVETDGNDGDFFGIHSQGLCGVFYMDVNKRSPHLKLTTNVKDIAVPSFKYGRKLGWMNFGRHGRRSAYKHMVHFNEHGQRAIFLTNRYENYDDDPPTFDNPVLVRHRNLLKRTTDAFKGLFRRQRQPDPDPEMQQPLLRRTIIE